MGDAAFYPHAKEVNIISVCNMPTGNSVFDYWENSNHKQILRYENKNEG